MKNITNNSNKLDLSVLEKDSQTKKSLFELATLEQENQFQTGIDNLKNEIENIFQLKSKHPTVVGNRSSRFLNYKNRFQ